jgi:hypothetical protein
VSENRVLGRIFGPKKDGIARGWRKLQSGEPHNLCPSTHIIRIIRSLRVGRTEHVAPMGEKRPTYEVLVGNPRKI